jgi:hypothetical protein
MREVEQTLRQRLAQNDIEVAQWIDAQQPALGSCTYEMLQRTVSRAGIRLGPLAVDACLAFCPVTIVLTTTHTELPRIDVELFRNPRPQPFIDALLANGLADDCNVAVDPLMLPLYRIQGIRLSELPAQVRTMADAVTLGTHREGAPCSWFADPNQGMFEGLSIAGGRVIGSLLIPVLFYADDLGVLPDALNGRIPEDRLRGFEQEASQALTVALGRWKPVRIDFIVSSPRLILDAILEATIAHGETAAYWASRAAVDAGGTDARIVCHDTSHDAEDGIAIGFDPGQDVECNVRIIANTQTQIDAYTKAFTTGAYAAGITTVRKTMTELQHSCLN